MGCGPYLQKRFKNRSREHLQTSTTRERVQFALAGFTCLRRVPANLRFQDRLQNNGLGRLKAESAWLFGQSQFFRPPDQIVFCRNFRTRIPFLHRVDETLPLPADVRSNECLIALCFAASISSVDCPLLKFALKAKQYFCMIRTVARFLVSKGSCIRSYNSCSERPG